MTDETLAQDVAELSARDAGLKRAARAISGKPAWRARPDGFEGLVRIITEQQVSVASGKAIFARVKAGITPFGPEGALALGAEGVRALGLTRQKSAYVVGIAEAMVEGRFDPAALKTMEDDEALKALTALKGVGPWTAAIYLLFCEGRRDLWPPHDVALMAAYAEAAGLDERPDTKAMDAIAARWAPMRGAAAHLLWSYYAILKGRVPE